MYACARVHVCTCARVRASVKIINYKNIRKSNDSLYDTYLVQFLQQLYSVLERLVFVCARWCLYVCTCDCVRAYVCVRIYTPI